MTSALRIGEQSSGGDQSWLVALSKETARSETELDCVCGYDSLAYSSRRDPFLNKGMQSLEAVQKFACKVCLKQWELDYDSMLQLLNLPRLSVRREYLKLTTMYNIVSGHMYFPPRYLCTK